MTLAEYQKRIIEIYNENQSLNTYEETNKIMIEATPKKDMVKTRIDIFKRELTLLQRCYGKTIEEIVDVYIKSSGSFSNMRKVLKGDPRAKIWTNKEDNILQEGLSSIEYENLKEKKGNIEINNRIKFLSSFHKPNE